MSVSPSSIERVPAWAAMPWLRAGFSTRHGGRSSADGAAVQNLGWTADDEETDVATNRACFVQLAAAGAAMQLVTLGQVHGSAVREVDGEPGPLMDQRGKALLKGDGLISRAAGRMLGVVTADCVPVLVVDPKERAVAAFHAGWRGTVARIVEAGIAALEANYASHPRDLLAAIGPSIGPCCFEVGEEVRGEFMREFAYANALVAGSALAQDGQTRFHLRLQEANRRQLIEAGLSPENISIINECTACSRLPDGRRKYFSYRAEQGRTGRMLSLIGIVGDKGSPISVSERDGG